MWCPNPQLKDYHWIILFIQETKLAKQNELQSVLNHKQEEVLSLKEKVEVLEAQVKSHEQSRDHLEANLRLAEEVYTITWSHDITWITSVWSGKETVAGTVTNYKTSWGQWHRCWPVRHK